MALNITFPSLQTKTWYTAQTDKPAVQTPSKWCIWHVTSLTLPHKSLFLQLTLENHDFSWQFWCHEAKTIANQPIDPKRIPMVPLCSLWSVHFALFIEKWPITKFTIFSYSRPPIPKPSYIHLDKPNTILNDLSWPVRPYPKPTKNSTKVHPKNAKGL